MKRKKIILWVALILSIPATFYTGMSVIFYSWLNAAEPERWPAEKAGIWAGGSLILTILLIILFVYCANSLKNIADSQNSEDKNKT